MNDINNKYENQGKLGNGHFGSVYKAYNKVVERTEAVKIINEVSKLGDKANLEAKVQHKLEHSNVVEIYDAFIKNDKLYILMEYLKGGSVQKVLDENGKLSIKRAIKITIDALHGLQFIHNQNFIHRDIKPSNILLNKKGVAKLSDFGLTTELDDFGKYSSAFGYIYHKAPEVLTKKEFSKKSDIFAIGLTLYRLVNGDSFIKDFDRSTIGYSIVSGEFPPRESYSADVPKKLRSIINTALEIDPDERYGSAHALRTELNSISIPIDWELINISTRKQVWEGRGSANIYKVEVTKSVFGNEYSINTYKGNPKLRKINKLCFEKLTLKDMNKKLNKILTSQI